MHSIRWTSAALIFALAMTAAAATGKAETNPAGAVCATLTQDSACAPIRPPARQSIKVAVGYCNERCYRQAETCRYRNEPREHCASRLSHCLANC